MHDLVGTCSQWSDTDSLLTTGCIAIPDFVMPAPAASSSAPSGSRDSAAQSGGREPFAVLSSSGDPVVDPKERWAATLSQFSERLAIREGDDRLRELIKGICKHPKVELRTLCLCAVAMCRAPGRFINAGELFEALASKDEGNFSGLPAVCEGLPVCIALLADSSMMPRRQRKDGDGFCFDHRKELVRYTRMPYRGRD